MKFCISKDEVVKIVSDHLQNKFQSGCKFDAETPSYGDWTFQEMTPEYLAEKAEKESEMAAFRAKWAAEDAAKKATQEAISKADGNF